MASRHVLRSLPGHIGFLLATATATLVSIIALYSYFYEGWGQPLTTAATYLVPPIVTVAVCGIAVRWPSVGGIVLMAGGLVVGILWLWRQSVAVGSAAMAAFTAVMAFAPVIVTGGLFLLEARHRRLLVSEGVQPSPRWWGRYYRLVLVIGVPLVAVALGPARQLPGLLARYDDGFRGRRVIIGNDVTLVWVPQGPGWNWRQPDGTYPSWSALATYGVSPIGVKSPSRTSGLDIGPEALARTGLCAYLNDDGTRLLPEPSHIWRLPTVHEVIRSLTRNGENAGCTWDGRSYHAECRQAPDKETPLWAPDQSPIYYMTSDVRDARTVLGVNYTGGVTPVSISATGLGCRCVRALQPSDGAAVSKRP